MNNKLRALALIALLMGFAAVVCVGFVFILSGGEVIDYLQNTAIRIALSFRQEDLQLTVSDDPSPVRFRVAPGDTPPVIANNLFAARLIIDVDLFVDYVRAEGYDTQLEAGTYFLNQAQTIPDIARMLIDSRSSHIEFRILEGWRIEEIAEAIDANPLFDFTGTDFLSVAGPGAPQDTGFALQVGLPAGASLEGFLYPDTYVLPPDTTPTTLRDTLIQAFKDVVGTQLGQDAAEQGFTLYNMVTLASIIEREAVFAEEHPLIASVYRNRLTKGITLDADPTVQYPIGGQEGRWWPPITQAHYRSVVSDYNTYLNHGLPPGPIASPSLSAIRAAVYPAESSYFYFRASCTRINYHEFATTFDEHLANGC